jgi:hypothetical protein
MPGISFPGGWSVWSLGAIFQVLMIVHFFRNRPEFYWLFVIFFLGPIGAGVYFVVEVMPGMRWKLPVLEAWERSRRKQWYEKLVKESPSQEALGQLASICAREGNHARAAELYADALDRDPGDHESRYGRARSYMASGNYEGAMGDLAAIVASEPHFKMHAAQLALAESYEALGRPSDAAAVYSAVLERNPVSAANFGLGRIMAEEGDTQEARRLLKEVVSKQTGLPRYLRRQERPWVAKAKKLLKTLPAQ